MSRIYISPCLRLEEINLIFYQYGRVLSLTQKKTCWFIEYEHPEEAAEAIDKAHGVRLGDHKIHVQLAHPKGNCYSCREKGHWRRECKEEVIVQDKCRYCKEVCFSVWFLLTDLILFRSVILS